MASSKSSKTPSKFVVFFLIIILTATAAGLVAAFSTFNGNISSKASVLSETAAQFSVASATAVANQDGRQVSVGSEKSWIGTGESTKDSYLGLYFTGAAIPANATIKSATLEVSAVGGWITTGFTFYGDTSGKGLFTQGDKLSTRSLTSANSAINENVKWNENTSYTFDVTGPVSELVGSAGKSQLALIVKGTGGKYGRKEIFGAPSTGKAPKLTVVYTSMVEGSPAPSNVPGVSPVVAPSNGPSVAPSPSSMPGMSMTPTPTSTGPGTGTIGANGHENAPEMTYWSTTGKNKPNPKYDKCDDGTDIVAAHMKFSVIGPDGKNYPTWHAPVVTNPITGVGKCYFGHEHGRDPKGYAFYDEVRKNFAYDANKNGTIDPDELAIAGIPFGYVNNQVDSYFASHPTGTMFMRHEDHVGHKVEYGNGEGDIGSGTDPFDNKLTGGLVVPIKTNSTPKYIDSGVRCYHFDKIHQGVNSPDALTNNMHEIIIHEKCISTRPGTPNSTTLLSGMMLFGAPGEFTEFCNDDRTPIITIGKNADTMNLPGVRNEGQRNIVTRACVDRTVLVPSNKFSSFPYEEWDGTLRVVKPNGTEVASTNGSWEVLDAIRYFNPASPNLISYISDLCYEKTADGRMTHGGACDQMTNYGTINGITWDDRRSAFQGRDRGQYMSYHRINNAGGAEVWYTDPFGHNAQTTPFPGSIKQVVSSVSLPEIQNADPRIVQREHDSGGGTVHAPN